jgi:hypothetical protein
MGLADLAVRSESQSIIMVTATPTTDTAAYAVGDRLGSIMELTNVAADEGRGVILRNMVILSNSVQTYTVSPLFFNELPTVASADNAAFNVSDAEMLKCVGFIIFGANGVSTASNRILTLTATNQPLTMKCKEGSRSLWCVLRIDSGTPTFLASDLTIQFTFQRL